MNIEECYEKLGGNYEEVRRRLPGLKMIERFIGIFLEDKSFEMLGMQIEYGNRREAFRAAHTLKGICANLGFTKLLHSVSRLTEELRCETDFVSDTAIELFKDVERDYEAAAGAIRNYLDKSE